MKQRQRRQRMKKLGRQRMKKLERKMVTAILAVLAGDLVEWEEGNTRVYNNFFQGCEAVVEWDGVVIACIKKSPETRKIHGMILHPDHWRVKVKLRAIIAAFNIPVPDNPTSTRIHF